MYLLSMETNEIIKNNIFENENENVNLLKILVFIRFYFRRNFYFKQIKTLYYIPINKYL